MLIKETLKPWTQANTPGTGQPNGRLDLNTSGARLIFRCSDYSIVTFQLNQTTAPIATAIVTIKRSLDGINWFGLENAATMGPAAANRMSVATDASGYDWTCAETTTAEGSACEGVIIAKGIKST